jgi:AcrR family transcriptional regulator
MRGSSTGGERLSLADRTKLSNPDRARLEARRRKPDARRAAVLEVARKAFLRDGYEEAQMVAMARTARVSTATLYALFADKSDLFRAMIMDLLHATEHRMAKQEEAVADRPMRERLTTFCVALIRVMQEAEVRAMTRLLFSMHRKMPDMAEEYLRRGYMAACARLMRYLAGLEKQGALRLPCLNTATGQLMALLMQPTLTHGLWLGDEALHDQAAEAQAADAIALIFCRYDPARAQPS